MCNHYRIKESDRVIEFARTVAEELSTPWEVKGSAWPGYEMPIVYQPGEKRVLASARWGVWPFYMKERPASLVANSRDDKLTEIAMWKKSARTRRCLVPMDGFYEWNGPKGSKHEVLITRKDGQPFWIAGIWSPDPDERGFGYSLVTTSPNEVIAALPHDRMILILDPADAARWIGSRPMEKDELLSFCKPYPSSLLDLEHLPVPARTTKAKKAKPNPGEDLNLL